MRRDCSAGLSAHRLKSVLWVVVRTPDAGYGIRSKERKKEAYNEKRRKTVELVLAWEGVRVVCLPKSNVHWLFSLVHSN